MVVSCSEKSLLKDQNLFLLLEKEIESFKKEMKKKYPGLGVSEGLTSGGKRQIRIRYAKKIWK
jgi:hypothetical protein